MCRLIPNYTGNAILILNCPKDETAVLKYKNWPYKEYTPYMVNFRTLELVLHVDNTFELMLYFAHNLKCKPHF